MAADTSTASQTGTAPLPIPKRRRLPWWGYLALVLAVVALSIGGFYGVWYFQARAELNDEIAKARERGEPVWFSDLAPEPVPGADNAAPLFQQAVRSLTWPNDQPTYKAYEEASKRAYTMARFGDEKGSRTAVDESAIRAVLDPNRPALDLLRQAIQKPRCQFPVDYRRSQPFGEGQLQHIQDVRNLSRLLVAEFYLALAHEDFDAALRIIEDQLVLYELLREDPYFISQYLRAMLTWVAIDDLAILLGQTELTENDRDRIDRRLESLATQFKLRDTVLAHRAGVLTSMEHLAENEEWATMHGAQRYPSGLLRPMVMQEQAFMMRLLSEEADAVDLTGPAGRAQQKAVEQELAEAPDRFMLTKALKHDFHNLNEMGMRYRQVLANARLALRIDRFHRQNAKLPGDLSALTDERLKEVPKCFYSERPVILKPQPAEGFLLYCPGDNGSDDGGERTPDAQEGLSAFRVIYKPPVTPASAPP